MFEALIYFLNYESIIQVSSNLKELSVEVNYSVDMLFCFLDNNFNLNICKSWVNSLDDKSLLAPYLLKYSRDSEWVKLLLTFYPEVDYGRFDKLLVSFYAHDNLDVIKWLINNGANIRFNNYESFKYMCADGHLETAKYLLSLIDTDEEKKLCIQAGDYHALTLSAINGHLEVVKWLVNNGANFRVNDYKPLQCACEHGHLEIAKYLFGLIDTDQERKLYIQLNNDRALRLSAKNGHLEVVKWLVSNGADIRANDYEAFRYACKYGHLETAKYLLSLIDMDDEEKKLCIQSDDNHALRRSAKYGHLEVVKWLVNNGANIRVSNYQPFRYACKYGHLETAKYLLSLIDTDDEERKLCVHSNDDYALRWSSNDGHLEVVKWLIDNEADIRVDNYEPFRYACISKHLEIAKYLFGLIDTDDEERKLCIHTYDDYALRWSARYGHLEVVKWLVNNGANIRSNDYEVIRFPREREIRDYLLNQLSEEERQQLIDTLN